MRLPSAGREAGPAAACRPLAIAAGIVRRVLTAIPPPHYSDAMISEFELLSGKIAQLAAMTHALRRENAELRVHNAALSAGNAELAGRMQQAQQRIAALLDSLPPQDEEAA